MSIYTVAFQCCRVFVIKSVNICIQEFQILSDKQKQDFLSKKMFEGHWLYDYIVPIANSPSLEDVLVEVGIMPTKIRNTEKGEYYSKIFPINSKPLCNDTLNEVLLLGECIKKSKQSNLSEYIDYCLSLLPGYKGSN